MTYRFARYSHEVEYRRFLAATLRGWRKTDPERAKLWARSTAALRERMRRDLATNLFTDMPA